MEQQGSSISISVIWRGKKYVVEINSDATLKELGNELRKLTNIKADTMRLIVPQSSTRSSKLLSPFADEHSGLSLLENSILVENTIRMMGASEAEIEEVTKNSKADLRIAGFDEEEKRMRQRMMHRPHSSLKLPQGTYIFCDFRTLQLPGIELNPPPSEALKRMHMLAADPGIVAIMNKHRWRVGIMTEMAPVGYVGVSPKCILGFNKNHGEEISLRLRTDDLKGFRKYNSIKKTLLHELAHMVYSEHDANFYALDKQLNQEADSLDWTRSRGHTLSGFGQSVSYEDEFDVGESTSFSQKLGGKASDQLASARASSVAAAYRRSSTNNSEASVVHVEPDPDDSQFNVDEEPDPDDSKFNVDEEPDPDDSMLIVDEEPDLMDAVGQEKLIVEGLNKAQLEGINQHGCSDNHNMFEPDPDDGGDTMEPEPYSEISGIPITFTKTVDEPDPDDSEAHVNNFGGPTPQSKAYKEPDPDDSQVSGTSHVEPDPDDSQVSSTSHVEPDPDDSQVIDTSHVEPDPDDSQVSDTFHVEPDPDDQEIRRIQDPVAVICNRLQKAIDMLRSEVNPTEASIVLQTLFKIISNVINHPNEMKFKRLRKANPAFQRNVANYKAAMEVLFVIGFNEDVVLDEIGKAETYLVLKRNDPGLLWLAKSSLETCIAY